MTHIILVIWFWSGVIFGLICASTARSKNRSPIPFFFVGFLLGLLGLILCLTAPVDAPKGMRAFKCPRCNAQTNVPKDSDTVECWQCHLIADSSNAPKR